MTRYGEVDREQRQENAEVVLKTDDDALIEVYQSLRTETENGTIVGEWHGWHGSIDQVDPKAKW